MSKIRDFITRAINPAAYYAELAARGEKAPAARLGGDVLPVKGWEAPRNPAAPWEQKSATLGDVLPNAIFNRAPSAMFDAELAIKNGLDASTWAFACMTLKADAAASVYWRADVWDSAAGKWVPEPEGALQALLDRPNAYTTTRQLITRAALHLELSGNAIITKIRASGARGLPLELWAQDPRYVKPILSRTEWISGYEIRHPGAQLVKVDARDVIHAAYCDPAVPYWGRSPMKTLMDTLETDNAARDWNKKAMANRAVSDGVFSTPQPLTGKQYDEVKRQVNEEHQGADNARRPWILSHGASWQPMSLSPVEMDFINSRHFTREEICAVYRVPPPMVGIYDRATLNNVYTGRQTFWEDTMTPLVDALAEQLTLQLARDFEGDGRRRRVWADTTAIPALGASYAARLALAERVNKIGFPVDYVAERFDLGLASGVARDVTTDASGAAPASGPPSTAVGAPDPEGV